MKILLGVCGSIACYKSFDLVRELVKTGHEVKVVLTNGAINFIKPELFRWLGATEVFGPLDDFKNPSEKSIAHIELARWADRLCVAPLSANSLAKFANGQCDDLLSSVVLSRKNNLPLILAPAMNPQMYANSITQENLNKLLGQQNCYLISPEDGQVVCGESGTGKFATLDKIILLLDCLSSKSQNAKTVVITTGATIAPIDPVRYVTNPSSGLTGLEIAKAFLRKGHKVHLIAGKNSDHRIPFLKDHPQATIHQVTTAEQMYNVTMELSPKTDIFVAAAAVSDFKFPFNPSKIKKEAIEHSLPLAPEVDILKSFLANKTPQQYVVGFAAENPLSVEVLAKKISSKPVDLLVGTHVNGNFSFPNGQPAGFQSPQADYLIWEAGLTQEYSPMSKVELANLVTHKAEEWFSSLKPATLS